MLTVAWHARADLRMRNVQGGAKLRQSHRIFRAAHHPRGVSEERPAPRERLQEPGPILESRTVDETARRLPLGDRFERGNQALALKSRGETALDKPVGGA